MSGFASRARALLPAAVLALAVQGCVCTEVETTHYVGVFDPQEQVTQELYRITIVGHSKPLSKVEYASGWVPAQAADLLTQSIRLKDHAVEISGTEASPIGPLMAERRFFELGPLGVSLEPQDARFVIVMSSDPDYFFQKMSVLLQSTMGAVPDTTGLKQKEAFLKSLGEERTKTINSLLNPDKEESK